MLLNMVMFKVTICDFGKMNINMTDITEKTENGELVTNRDQLVVMDNIEHQDKGELVANCDRFNSLKHSTVRSYAFTANW